MTNALSHYDLVIGMLAVLVIGFLFGFVFGCYYWRTCRARPVLMHAGNTRPDEPSGCLTLEGGRGIAARMPHGIYQVSRDGTMRLLDPCVHEGMGPADANYQ